MCGRFALDTTRDEIEHLIPESSWGNPPLRLFNIAPGSLILTVLQTNTPSPGGSGWIAQGTTWGAQAPKAKRLTINARIDRYKDWERKGWKRCAVLASGFYEWDATKQPYYCRPRDGGLMGLAALTKLLETPKGYTNKSVILTTRPADVLAPIHDRMPVLLERETIRAWLQDAPAELFEAPFPSERLEAYAVSKRVNKADVDGHELLEPVAGQPRLL